MLKFKLYSKENEVFFENAFKNVFSDKLSLDFFYKNCFSSEHTYVAEENGKIYSIISLIPETIFYENIEYSALYLFHIETAKGFRKMGIMKKLFSEMLNSEKENGISYIFACPKGEGKEYLEKQGFTASFAENCFGFSRTHKEYSKGKEWMEDDYIKIRNKFIEGKNRVLWRESELVLARLLSDKMEFDEKLFSNYKINEEYGVAFEFLCDIENLERFSDDAMKRLSLLEMKVLYPDVNIPTYMAHLNPTVKKIGSYKKLSENVPDLVKAVYLGFPI